MIKIQLSGANEIKCMNLMVQEYDMGIALAKFIAFALLNKGTDGFTLSLKEDNERHDPDFPNFHLEQAHNRYLFQVFASERISPDGMEGWYTLVEGKSSTNVDLPQLVMAVPGVEEVVEGYVASRLAEGVQFSRELFVSLDSVKEVLANYPGKHNIQKWLKDTRWSNLGLI